MWFRAQLAGLLPCILVCAVLTGGVVTTHAEPSRPEPAVAITVGAPADSFPYSYVDDAGNLTGFATDLIRAVAATMDISIRHEARPSAELTEMLRTGQVDVLELFSQSAERETYADFTVPFLRLQGALFIASRNSRELTAFADLHGRRLAVVGIGSTALAFIRDQKLDMQIEYAPAPETALRWVQEGRCDATFLSRLTALTIIKKKRIPGLEVLGEPITQYDIRHSFAVRDGNAQLLGRLNEGLALVHSSGEYDRIYQRWFVGIDAPMFTRDQVIQWAALVFGGVSVFALWALIRQRRMHHRLRRQAAEIAEQAEMLRALYENIPVGILVFGRMADELHLVALNDHGARMLALPDTQGVGVGLGDLPWPPAWMKLAHKWTRDWPNPGSPTHEEQVVELDKKIVLDVVRVALHTPATGEERLFVLLEDITERKRSSEEVAQGRRLRAIGELVGGIAHEFNNMMTPLLLQASDVKMSRTGDHELHASMDVIIDTTRRAAELTRRLLTFGRRDESKAELLDVAAIAANCCALVRPALDRRISWETEILPGLPRLLGVATDLHQVLHNLVINARDALMDRLEATPGEAGWSARLRVSALHHPGPRPPDGPVAPARPAGWIELVVEDNGIGMDKATVDRAFEPFFTTKEVGKGTGLGLATAWNLVNKAGGEIRVESTPGIGTTFRVWLPLRAGTPAAIETSPASPGPSTSRPRLIFVVDDEPAVAKTVCTLLHRAGHTTEVSTTGTSALERIACDGASWDAVLLDLNLPGANGLAVARALRSRGYEGRIILMSGRINEIDLSASDMPRIDARLSKPFHPADLAAALGP